MQERLVMLISEAVRLNASDVHLFVKDNCLKITFRTSIGMVDDEERYELELLSYLRYLANMDLTNSLKMQSGHFELKMDNLIIPIRFSYLQTPSIQSGVIRLMNTKEEILIENLSKKPEQNKSFKRVASYHEGLLLFSGATGSGKTTTMYALLDYMIKQQKNIITLEDPIEIYKNQIVQIQIDKNITYEDGLKQILRHDPDVIMVGEIRDPKTAQMVIRCALTGHLVLSTIHSKGAENVINRMLELGISKSDLRATLRFISNQRMLSGKKKEKVCVYEMLDDLEIQNILDGEHHVVSKMESEISYVLKAGHITLKEANNAY